MKKLLCFFTISLSFCAVCNIFAQNKIEDQIENNKAFEYNVMRETVTVFPNSQSSVKSGILEVKKATPKQRKIVVVEEINDIEENNTIVNDPSIINTGSYTSFFINASFSGKYDETWQDYSNFNRNMTLLSTTSNLGYGLKLGNKFNSSHAEFEISYENMSYKSDQTPYQRKIYGPSLGFNMLLDVGRYALQPYIGVGVGYTQMNVKRTGIQVPLFGEAKDKSNSYFFKPIAGLSFNIPGGSIFAELSYKVYNNVRFKGIYCTSVINCRESTVNYNSFGVYNLTGGVTLYF